MNRLRDIRDPRIAEVRGLGLLVGIELVNGPDKSPLAESKVVQIQKAVRDRGVIIGRNADTVSGFGNVLTISPPLVVTQDQAAEIAGAIESALAALPGPDR
jgi:4-aminobutyrate aminotransferase-like enzyme